MHEPLELHALCAAFSLGARYDDSLPYYHYRIDTDLLVDQVLHANFIATDVYISLRQQAVVCVSYVHVCHIIARRTACQMVIVSVLNRHLG